MAAMLEARPTQLLEALASFFHTPFETAIRAAAQTDPVPGLLALFRRTVAEVPAYAAFLHERGIDPQRVTTLEAFRALPLTTKADYVRPHPLATRCRAGRLSSCDMLAVSSGSTGEPTVWPRALADEIAVSARFEQIFHDAFEADRTQTLAVVCFPLGTWVGGMFSASCCRLLASKGYPITTATPGNNKAEILRVVRTLAPSFEQTVLLGYPPFLKEVIDAGVAEGIPWADYRMKLVFAGEVISEDFRALMGERAGLARPLCDAASMYGTADAGVLGVETPLTIAIRRFLHERSDAARALFGESRLPTLVQYDPQQRYFEEHARTLVFSGDNGVPLIRYHIEDEGGVCPYQTLLSKLADYGFDAEAAARAGGARAIRDLPFVYVFGRSHFAVSYYGANVFPDMVSIALEQPTTRSFVSGKFVLEVETDDAGDAQLAIAIELSPDGVVAREAALEGLLADAVVAVLVRLNSEFANYVPSARQRPCIRLFPPGHPSYFPTGVKHRYVRK